MIDVASLIQLKAFARQDGFLLTLLWIASFLGTMMSPASSIGSMLALVTPFFVGWMLVRFRNEALDGRISFRRALAFSIYTFFYASLLFAIAQWAWFRFFDHGTFISLITANFNIIDQAYKANGMSTEQLKQGLNMLGSLSPIELAFIFMMQNIVMGVVLSIPIAALGKRKNVTRVN